MASPQPSQEEIVQAIYQYGAELVKAGNSPQQVESKLMEKGLDKASASVVVNNLFSMRSKAVKEAGKKNMLFGALWCIGGTVVTIGTYAAASDGGGTYVIAWGAIIFGAIQFFRGLAQYNS